ncbi:hypothetical protein ACHAXT_007896 [Thalassiosira profunda]
MSSDEGHGAPPPAIAYTKRRTATKTRNAASAARRRKNAPLVHAGGGGGDDSGRDPNAWFARKSAGWTDEEIKSHLVSGGQSQGGKSFSLVGDVILGEGATKEKRKKRRGGPRFAWEEEEDEEGIEHDAGGYGRSAPMTLDDIMDEKDKADLCQLRVGGEFQMKEPTQAADVDRQNGDGKPAATSKRRQNAALDELAQVSGVDHGGGLPTSANESIGWRLLRVWGYRSRLGVAYVPLSGRSGSKDDIDADIEQLEGEGKPAHEAKWLASRRLRAVRLPSIQNVESNDDGKGSQNTVLRIPPPKLNRHGMGYDPFKNAPEFRAFHEQRRALAQKRGRATDDVVEGDRYLTDNLRKGGRAVWDTMGDEAKEGDEDGSDMEGRAGKGQSQHAHYAADRDYANLIGTKAASGFALEDEDDANVYQDGEDDDQFPRGHNGLGGADMNQYAMEVQSPVASDEEDHDGLFGKLAITGKGRVEKRTSEPEDAGKLAEAWGAWGTGVDGSGAPVKKTTMDGKPLLPGFALGQKSLGGSVGQAKVDAPKRWKGPDVPSGYVLKRHVFPVEDHGSVVASASDGMDSGLGLDLQRRKQQPPSRLFVPKVLPPPEPTENLRARDGTELNFHAVKESMKNRFVTSGSEAGSEPVKEKEENARDLNKEEWVQANVAPWIPARLLCKRWGVPVPSTTGMSAAGDGPAGGRARNREEEYFRQNVFEVVQRQKDDGAPAGQSDMQREAGVDLPDSGTGLGGLDEEGLPPERPAEEVFKSIFDAADSDMDISSDESDADADADEKQGKDVPSVPPETTERKEMALTAETAASKSPPKKLRDDNAAPSSTQGSVSSSSHSSKRKPKRQSHQSRDDSETDEDKKRKKHSRRHRRRRSESDDSDSDGSGDRRRRKKKRHKHHRSRSRHKKRKHKN